MTIKRSSLRIISALLLVALLLGACAPAAAPTVAPAPPTSAPATTAPVQATSAPQTKGTFLVGYSAAGLIDELQIGWSKAFQKTIEDAGGKVIIVDSQNKIAKQLADIEDLLTQKIDYLAINPVDEAGIVPAIQAANAAHVPVITLDRGAAGGDIAVQVGFDNYKAGFDAGEYIAKMHNYKGEVAQIEGMAGTSVARERGGGFNDAIKKYPDMKVVVDQPTDWSTEQALKVTEDLLTSHPNVVGIWTHADLGAMGAVQALKAANKISQVTVVGMGMFAGGPESIKAGDLAASWELYADQLGQIAGQAVVDLHNGKKVEPKISTKMTFVTKENIDKFLTTSAPQTKGTFLVGYSAAGLIDELQIGWSKAFQKTIEDAGGKVIIVDSQNKIAKQLADIEDLLTQKIDYLAINPVDEAGIVPAIQAANAAHVPVITLDRGAAGGDIAVQVGFDNYKAGFDAGEYIAKMHNYKGEVAQIEGMAGTSVARERGGGFNDAIKKYPDMKVVVDQPTDWSTEQALKVTEDLLTSHPNVVGIWTHADLGAMGAVQALKAANKISQVTVVGMGMFAGGPESIKAGDLAASWELYADQLGQIAGQAVVDLHNGKKVEPKISTKMTFVTKENIDQFLK